MAKRIDPQLINRLAAEYEPQMRKAFLRSIEQITDRIRIGEVEEALKRGDVEAALRLIGFDPLDFRPLSREITIAYEAGGVATARAIEKAAPKAAQLVIRFDARHVRAETWVVNRSSTLVSNIVDKQLNMLRSVMYEGLQAGKNPKTVALDIAGRVNKATGKREGGIIGLTDRQNEWQTNYLAEITSDKPSDLRKALRRDLVTAREKALIKRAIRDGKPLDAKTRQRLINNYRNRSLKYRADTIARTETLEALNTANLEAYTRAVENGDLTKDSIRRFAHTAGDERVRHDHRLIPGMNSEGVRIDQPFATPDGPVLTAPFSIQCRCWIETRIDFLGEVA